MSKGYFICKTPCYKEDYVACEFHSDDDISKEDKKEGYDYCLAGYGDGNTKIEWVEPIK